MNPTPKILRPNFAIEKQFDYSIFIATLFQDLLGDASYDDVPERYKVNFAGVKFVDKDEKTKYIHGKYNRWVRVTSRRTQKHPYKPQYDELCSAQYTLNIDHPLLMDWVSGYVALYTTQQGYEYTSCSVGMTYWSNTARAWSYEGHHADYAKRAIEHIIESAIAYQWRRRQRMKFTRKFL